MHPYLLRRRPFFERKNVCNFQENGVRTRCAAIANHSAIVNSLPVVNLLRVVFLVRRGPLGVQEISVHIICRCSGTCGERRSEGLNCQKTREGCGCPKFLSEGFSGDSMLTPLEKSSPTFRQHDMLSCQGLGTFRQ